MDDNFRNETTFLDAQTPVWESSQSSEFVFHARVRVAVDTSHCKCRVGDGTDSQDACKCPFYAPTRGTPPRGMQLVRLEQARP